MAAPKIEYAVGRYDSQSEGMMLVSGYRVSGTVTGATGRKFASSDICICGDKADAEEIAELLNEKYGEKS